MTKYSKNPWPTDGITRKQLDREVDKLTRRIDHWKSKVQILEDRLDLAENMIQEIISLRVKHLKK